MEDQEIVIESIDELINLIEQMPDNTVLEIDLGGEADDNERKTV